MPAIARLARHRFHLIEAGRFTSALAPESKGKPDLELLLYLHGAGRSETEKWLARTVAPSAATSSVDLAQHFLAARAWRHLVARLLAPDAGGRGLGIDPPVRLDPRPPLGPPCA